MNSGNNRRQLQAIIVAALMLCMAITGVTQDVSGIETETTTAKINTTNMGNAGAAGGKALMKASFRVDAADMTEVGETSEDAGAVTTLLGLDAAEALADAENQAKEAEEEAAQADESSKAAESESADDSEVSDESEGSNESGVENLEDMKFPKDGDAACSNSSRNNSVEGINWDLRVMANIDDYLKVRKEPDSESEVVGKMEKGDVGVVIGYENGWIHMISGDLEGYMNAEYCVAGDEALDLSEEICDVVATTNTQGLRIRETADADGKVIRTLDKNTKLKVVSPEKVEEEYDAEEWVPVKDGSSIGFVSAEYVDVEWDLGEGMTKEEEAAIQKEKEEAAARGVASVNTPDVTLIAALIQAEGNGQPYEGKVAIANVVMNRVHSPGYPNNVHGVVYQRGQFGPALTGKVARIVAQGPSQANINAASAAIAGTNYIGGCTHFKGLASGAQGIVIGGHVFY